MKRAPPAEGLWTEQVIADSTAEGLWPGATQRPGHQLPCTVTSCDREALRQRARPHARTFASPRTDDRRRNDATCGPQAWLTGSLHYGGIRSVRSPLRRPPLLAAPIATPLQCGRPEKVRPFSFLNYSYERCPQLTQPQVRLLSVSAGTSLQGAARNPRSNPHEHSIPLGQGWSSGGCSALVSCATNRKSGPLILIPSLIFPHDCNDLLPARVPRPARRRSTSRLHERARHVWRRGTVHSSLRGERALRGMPASVHASYKCVAIREFRVGFGDLGFGSLSVARDRCKCSRKRSKTPHGSVSRHIRSRCTAVIYGT